MPNQDKYYEFKHFTNLDSDVLRHMQEHLERQTADAAFGSNGTRTRDDYNWGSETTMKDLNARIVPKKRPAPQVQVYMVQTVDKRRACVQVLVPNAFGTLEPLCDGETGEPVDFYSEFGDPRTWSKNMGPAIEEAAKRAAKTCNTLMRSRVLA